MNGRHQLRRWAPLLAAMITFVLTVVAVLLTLNLTLGDKQIDQPVHVAFAVTDPQFARSMGALLGGPIVAGNNVQALPNGDHIFPAMLEAIRGARQSITFETYIYWSGTIGKEFSDALIERARAGVRVHVLVDWWGAEDIEKRYRKSMEAAGVALKIYNPLRIASLGRLNNRTHRKLLIVDGKVGFTGGVGIADSWRGHAQDPEHWRDTHFRVTGPVVSQLQSAFMDNWITVSDEVLHGPAYLPPLEPTGGQRAQVYTSAPGGGAENVQLLYLMSIAAARESIHLSMAYFVPDEVAVQAFVAARQRGVRVQILLPGEHTDRPFVQRASRATWGRLLRAGIEIHRYEPTMYHCKVLVVDGLWTSVGSTNFDARSFSVNDEANLNVLDAGFATEQIRLFNADLALSHPVTLAQWESRPWSDKMLDAIAGAFAPQL